MDQEKARKLLARMNQFQKDINEQIGTQFMGDPRIYARQYTILRDEAAALVGQGDPPVAEMYDTEYGSAPSLGVMAVKAQIGQLLIWFKAETGIDESIRSLYK
ncbi:MAG: hypothetical protein ACYC6L_14015 [Anaerolineae bacterium]